MDYKKLLNKKQYEAVTTSSPFVRVVAGAGSGKTRVLSYRIAYLIDELGVHPSNIVAITFTNKVAREMKERIASLIGEKCSINDLFVKTYHSYCAYFLRREIHRLGYPSSFTIIDEEDQEKLIKEIAVQEFSCSKSDPLIKKAISYIGHHKTRGKLPYDLQGKEESFPEEYKCLKIFELYEEKLQEMKNLDFDDLIIKTILILEAYPVVKETWQSRIDHILIDEFQDTNDLQYKLLKLLKKDSATLYVVGDPDQTIYTWRGANQNIILDIERAFGMETVILDQNYRSSQIILDTANKLIAHNRKRVKKDLFTENERGEPIKIYSCFKAEEEARWVVEQIRYIQNEMARTNKEFSFKDIAVLYRSSYLTLPFEKELNRYQIPYKIFGGLRFYQRKEIKDVLAYFNLLINTKNDIAFLRIVNVPRRGLGDKALTTLKKEASDLSLSLYDYVLEMDKHDSKLKTSVIIALTAMVKKLEAAKEKLTLNLEAYSVVLKELVKSLGYEDYLLLDEEDGAERLENVKSLYDDILSYIEANPTSGFQDYMENVSLQNAQDEINDGDFVSLMTVHTAKGLEFPYVFLIGLNEGVFPSARTLEESAVLGLEEERRLCYVGYTRAMKKLFLSCNSEYSYVVGGNKIPSRFFKEAGLSFKSTYQPPVRDNNVTSRGTVVKKAAQVTTNDVDDWKIGDLVNHASFGDGVVIEVTGPIIKVSFKLVGVKSLLANHPTIKRIKKGGFDA